MNRLAATLAGLAVVVTLATPSFASETSAPNPAQSSKAAPTILFFDLADGSALNLAVVSGLSCSGACTIARNACLSHCASGDTSCSNLCWLDFYNCIDACGI